MGLGIAICKELDTLYQNFDKRENLIARDEEFSENEGKEIEQPKTFSSIAKEDDILQMYLKDVGKIKLLNAKEEKMLGKEIREGEEKKAEIAKRKLVQANLRLVVSIAKKYIGQGVLLWTWCRRVLWDLLRLPKSSITQKISNFQLMRRGG